MYIDISTEEKKEKVLELFKSFNSKKELFEYYGVSDNAVNTKYINNLFCDLDIDKNYYVNKRRKKRFCLYCGKEFIGGDCRKKFCNRSCAASYNNSKREVTEETKQKIRRAQLKHFGTLDRYEYYTNKRICKYCGNEFDSKHKETVFCSRECARRYRRLNEVENKEKKDIYKSQTVFRFKLKDYPNEFDFGLIKENGWYQASNHGNNLNGVSRDHMFSVDEGYKQCIDPYYISHPANCKLMKHEENFLKRTECSITIEELKWCVKEWNEKYGVYPNLINYDNLEKFKNKI